MRPRKGNTLLKYDLNHKLIANKSLNLKYKDEKIYLDKIIKTQNGTFGYMFDYNKKQKKWQIFSSRFNEGKFSRPRLTYSHPYKHSVMLGLGIFGGGGNADNTNEMVVSMDDSHVGYSNVISSKDKKEPEKIAVAVFDADMKKVWSKMQKFKYTDKKIVIAQTVVSNDGVIYLLGKLFTKKKQKAKGLPRFDFKLFRITKESMDEFDIKLGKPNIAPTDAGLFFPGDNTSEFIISGFYTDAEKRSGLKGMFFSTGDNSKGIDNVQIHDFDDEFLMGIASKKDIEKDRGLKTSFNIENLLSFSDGTVGFIAEQFFITTSTTRDSRGNTRTTYTYHTNSLIIPRFTMDGELVSLQKIPKTFRSQSMANVSYTFALANNKTYLIFNDMKTRKERKDMKKEDGGKKKKARYIYTDLIVLNNNGEIEYNETLFNSKELGLLFVPFMSDFDGDKFLIGALRGTAGKKYSFGVLDLK